MRCLPDGTQYKDEHISEDLEVFPGDQFVCVFKNHPEQYKSIHERVVTVSGVSSMGGIAVFEYERGTHFVRRCFHEIIREEVDLSGFDEIFT